MKGLTNDPQVNTVILSRLLTEKRQIALTLLTRGYGVATFALNENAVSSGTFDSLSLVTDELASNLVKIQNLATYAEGLIPSLQTLIKEDVKQLTEIIDKSLLFIEDQFLAVTDVTLKKAEMNAFFEALLQVYYQDKELLKNEFKQQLNNRTNELLNRTYTIASIVTLVLLIVIYLFVGMSLSISMTTNSLTNIASQLANGDTTVSASIRTRDELSLAIKAFNQMAINVRNLVESVQVASKGVATQSNTVKQLTQQTGEVVEQQIQDTQAGTEASNELLRAVETVSQNTLQVTQALKQASQQAVQGRDILADARQATNELGEEISHSVEVIHDLSQQSDSINKVLEVIKSIAEQTNLLALNAAIEAARAGEQGRGFAVVADEVRSLAQRTRESTDEIQVTISSLQSGIDSAVKAMTQSDTKAKRSIEEAARLDDALNIITQSVDQIRQQNTATEQASQQQNDIAKQIETRLSSIQNISATTENNVQQSISTSLQLAEHVEKLEDVVSNFKT